MTQMQMINPSSEFSDEARKVAKSCASRVLRITLEYLLLHALGRTNAKPVTAITNHLLAHGIQMSDRDFQQTILKDTRENSIFIGSNRNGFFLIDDIEDAKAMRNFYEDRIAAETHHLNNLRTLAARRGWAI